MILSFRDAPRVAIAALIAAAVLFGFGAFEPGAATAAAELDIQGFCEPDSVRPNEAVMVSCTTTLTNTGVEPLTGLTGSVFIAEGCSIPSRFTFVDRMLNGVLMAPLGLSFDVPDIGPGETLTQISRVATDNFTTGLTGGSVTITSTDKPDVSATINLCWDVQADAEAPSDKLTVTKTTLRTTNDVDLVDEPEAPPRAVGGQPVPTLPPFPPTGSAVAEFEIVIVNVSDATLSDVVLLDVPTGDAIFVNAEPPPSSFDSLRRPFWNIGEFAPGEEFSVIATYAPHADANCSFADDIAIVSATDGDGSREDYIAFSDFGVQVGACVFEQPDFCSFYPPDGDFPVTESCDAEVCWTTSPDGVTWPVFDCADDVSYCWSTAPGEGGPSLSPCDAPVCWISFGGADFEYWGEVPCDAEFCQYTSPDGFTTTEDCAFPICWAEDPVGGFWQQIYGCEEFFEGGACWFVAPDGSRASLLPCEEEVCWVTFAPGDFIGEVPCDFELCLYTAPDGSTTTTSDCEFPVCWSSPPDSDEWQQVYDCGVIQEWCWFAPPGSPELAVLNPCDYSLSFAVNLPDGGMVHDPWQLTIFDEDGIDWCWPIPPEAGDFFTFPVFCEEIESIFWFQQDDGVYVPSFGPNRGCIGPVPLPPRIVAEVSATAGDFIFAPCTEDDAAETDVQGSSIPVEIAAAVVTPAELSDGSSEMIEPQPSLSVTPVDFNQGEVVMIEPSPSVDVTPAELVPSDRVESFPDFPEDGIILPVDGGGDNQPTAPPETRDVVDPELDTDGDVDLFQDERATDIVALPYAGSATGTSTSSYVWIALGLALAGTAASVASLGLRKRRTERRRL